MRSFSFQVVPEKTMKHARRKSATQNLTDEQLLRGTIAAVVVMAVCATIAIVGEPFFMQLAAQFGN